MTAQTLPVQSATRVFISYSRHDGAIADALRTALISRGYDAWIDREDIAAAEEWRPRLEALILKADVVVFLLTDASLRSPVCGWEVARTRELAKRILPVAHGPRSEVPPQELGALNWIFTDHPRGGTTTPEMLSAEALERLCSAIDVDIRRVRAHAELVARAEEWLRSGRDSGLLLAASLVAQADELVIAPPSGAASTDLLQTFIDASRIGARGARAREVARLANDDLQRRHPRAALRRIRAFAASEAHDVFEADASLADAATKALTKVGLPFRRSMRSTRASARLAVFEAAGIIVTCSGATVSLHDAEDFRRIESVTFDIPVASLSVDEASLMMALIFVDGTVFLWDALTKREGHQLISDPMETQVAKFAEGGAVVLTFEVINHGRVWSASSGQELAHVKAGFTSFVDDAFYDEASQRIIAMSQFGVLRQWRQGEGHEIKRNGDDADVTIERWHADALVRRGRFDPSGRFVFVESERLHPHAPLSRALYGLKSGVERHTMEKLRDLPAETAEGRAVTFSSDGDFLALQRPDQGVEVYANADGALVARVPAGVAYDQISLSAGARLLLALGEDGAVDVWRRNEDGFVSVSLGAAALSHDRRRMCRQLMTPAGGGVTSLDVVGGFLVAALRDGAIGLSEVAGPGHKLKSDLNARATCVAGSPKGDAILACFGSGHMGIVDVRERRWRFLIKVDDASIWSGAWTADGTRVIVGAGSGKLHVVDASAGVGLHSQDLHASALLSIASRSGDDFVAVGASGWLLAIKAEAAGLTELWRRRASDVAVTSIAVAADGRTCAVGLADGYVEVLDLETETKCLRCRISAHAITSVDVSSEGSCIAVATKGGEVAVQSIPDGRSLFWTEESDRATWSVRFAWGAEAIAAGFEDGTVRVFDIAHIHAFKADYRAAFMSATDLDASMPEMTYDEERALPVLDSLPVFFGGWLRAPTAMVRRAREAKFALERREREPVTARTQAPTDISLDELLHAPDTGVRGQKAHQAAAPGSYLLLGIVLTFIAVGVGAWWLATGGL